MNKKISSTLKKCGVPPHYLGYDYLIEAIKLVHEERNNLRSITKILYPTIAKKFDTTPSRVERAIRHAVEISFFNIHADEMYSIFGNTIPYDKGKVTNAHFIAAIVELIEE